MKRILETDGECVVKGQDENHRSELSWRPSLEDILVSPISSLSPPLNEAACSMDSSCACRWLPTSSTHHGSLLSCLRELMPLVSDPQPVGANSPAKCSCPSSLAEAILRCILYSSSEDPGGMEPQLPTAGV